MTRSGEADWLLFDVFEKREGESPRIVFTGKWSDSHAWIDRNSAERPGSTFEVEARDL